MSRKLATIQRITSINPIPDANAIEVAGVLGWKVVIKKNEFHVGELVVYLEIDSLVSKDKPEFEFLKSSNYRIRTVKLRGQISQGICFPLDILNVNTRWHIEELERSRLALHDQADSPIGLDVSEELGIEKYEAPIPAELAGDAKGALPSFFQVTDEERCIEGNCIIKTNIGDYPISVIIKNPNKFKILSYDCDNDIYEYVKIINVFNRRNNFDWYKITLENNEAIILTSNHRIYLPKINAYRCVCDLNINDEVFYNKN